MIEETIQDQQSEKSPQLMVNLEWRARMEMEERLQAENIRLQNELAIKSQKSHARQHSIMVVVDAFKDVGYPVTGEEQTKFIVKQAEIIYQYITKDL